MDSPSPSDKPDAPPIEAETFGAARTGEGFEGKRINLVKLAEAQKRLLRVIVAYFMLPLGFTFLIQVLPPMGMLSLVAERVLVVLMLGMAVAAIVFAVRMGIAYGLHPMIGVLGGLALVIPCAGILLLLVLNQYVTDTLEQAGVKVGLLGVGTEQMQKLRIGICRECGYDLRGLPSSTCPECGKAITA
jgi:hypothetical protein